MEEINTEAVRTANRLTSRISSLLVEPDWAEVQQLAAELEHLATNMMGIEITQMRSRAFNQRIKDESR